MKLNKILTTVLAGSMVLTLAACGNQSTSSSTKHDEATSSQVSKAKRHTSHKKNSAKQNSASSSSASASQATNNSSQQGGSSQVNNNNQQASMSESDARDLLKTHLGMQRDAAGQNGQSMPVQPTADAVDGFTAQQNGNGWTIFGNYNGKTYSYHVSTNGVTAQ